MRNAKLRCLYHKDHGHIFENCKTLKQFLEGLVSKDHVAKYMKNVEKGKKDGGDDDDSDEEASKKLVNRVVAGIIAAIQECNQG